MLPFWRTLCSSAIAWLVVTAPFAATPAHAATCVTTDLASYVSLGGTGCTIGLFTAKDFGFDNSVFGGGYSPFAASAVTVTPLVTLVGLQFNFSAPFSVTGTEFGTYVMSYTLDPPPILTGMEDDLLTNTPVAPGIATITTSLCVGAAFTPPPLGTTCAGTPASVSVFHAGTTFNTTATVLFAPTNLLGVRHVIDLKANGASASFTSFNGTAVTVPEPSTVWCGAVLLSLAAWRAKRRQA